MSVSKDQDDLSPAVIASKSEIAAGIFSFELHHPSGLDLRPFSPGSHLSVRVPSGAMRKYSMCNDAGESHRYVIAVKRDEAGRGGSVSLTDRTAPGDTLLISKPRNDFPLVESRGGYVFIAGGIGITPIMSMIRHVKNTGERFKLYYCTRSQEATAFREELTSVAFNANTLIHHDNGEESSSLDLWPVLEKPKGQHVYCCGPRPLMDAVRDMTGHWPATAIHFESFVDAAPESANDQEFKVRVSGSPKTIVVPPGVSILEALRKEGYEIASSCESGSCGTCRTKLLSGIPDHRDFVLPQEERGRFIMLCVSRAKSGELVIEL
jgi:phthalate 4,5-dioxygenase reductase component